jgi:hypothetical protein
MYKLQLVHKVLNNMCIQRATVHQEWIQGGPFGHGAMTSPRGNFLLDANNQHFNLISSAVHQLDVDTKACHYRIQSYRSESAIRGKRKFLRKTSIFLN